MKVVTQHDNLLLCFVVAKSVKKFMLKACFTQQFSLFLPTKSVL